MPSACQNEAVTADIERPPDDKDAIRGFIFDVATGKLNEVT